MERLRHIEERIRAWMLVHADSIWGQCILGAMAFLEASIFPLTPTTLMVAMVVLGERGRWAYLALLATVTSVLGGIAGYFVGLFLYDSVGIFIVTHYHLVDAIVRIGAWFDRNTFLTIFVAAFTPIPYKAFTIGGGFFKINLFIFTIASFFGRGLQFFLVGYLAELFGERVARPLFRYVALMTLGAVLIIALALVAGSFVKL